MIIFLDEMETSESVTRAGGACHIENLDGVIAERHGYGYLGGRVEWATALGDMFASYATNLLQAPTILGALVEGAAKIYSLGGNETSTPKYSGL